MGVGSLMVSNLLPATQARSNPIGFIYEGL